MARLDLGPDAATAPTQEDLKASAFGFAYAAAEGGAGSYSLLAAGVRPSTGADVRASTVALVDAIIAKANDLNDTLGLPDVPVPCGTYRFDAGLSIPPWVKLRAAGGVVFDFSNAPTNTTGIRSENAAPSGAGGTAPAHRGPFIDGSGGAFDIVGPGATGTSIGLDLGQSVTGGADRDDFRDVDLKALFITGWGVGLRWRNKSTHQNSLEKVRIENYATYGMVFEDGVSNNAGERLGFRHGAIAKPGLSTGVAISMKSTGWGATFDHYSFDYNRGGVLAMDAVSKDLKVRFLNGCWFEGNTNDAEFTRIGGSLSDNIQIVVDDALFIRTTSKTTVPPGARTDGESMPRAPIAKGAFDFVFGNIAVSYKKPYHLANEGLFMCDDAVRAICRGGIKFPDYAQFPSRSLISHWNYDFSKERSTNAGLTTSGISGWIRRGDLLNMTVAMDAVTTFAPSDRSLKFSCSAAGGYATIQGDAFPVSPGQTIMGQVVARGGLSTGNMQLLTGLGLGHPRPIAPVKVLSAVKTGGNVVITTDGPHSLTVGRTLTFGGDTNVSGGNYNRKFRVEEVTSATFTIKVATSMPDPTGTWSYVVHDFEEVMVTPLVGNKFKTQYDDPDFVGHTGDRLWWCRQAICTMETIPAGITMAVPIIASSENDAGDVFNIGLTIYGQV